MQKDYGAFMPGDRLKILGRETGPLAGKTFAAKDVFDIAGYPTSNGQPTWPKTRPLPETHAAAVEQLLNAGAALEGKTVCDEMCYSLAGDNAHYGAPVNPAAPDRAVGGSSSGSASAVAGGLVICTSTDCGGSADALPAGYLRYSSDPRSSGRYRRHLRLFDVVGWFARTVSLLETVGRVLLQGAATHCADTGDCRRDALARLHYRERAAANTAAIDLIGRLGLETHNQDIAPEGLTGGSQRLASAGARNLGKSCAVDYQERPRIRPGVRERLSTQPR